MSGKEPAGARSQPRDGDVVVTRESGSAAAYSVRQVPGVVQLGAASRDEAFRLARNFVVSHVVDLWYCEGGAYTLVERHRRREGQS